LAEDYFSNLNTQETTTDTLPGDYFSNLDDTVSSGDYFKSGTIEETPPVIYDDEFANSWSNRFSIATDNMQSSLYKGLDLVADSLYKDDCILSVAIENLLLQEFANSSS